MTESQSAPEEPEKLEPQQPETDSPEADKAEPEPEQPQQRRPRTWVRTALRWGTAVVLCGAAGTGSALAVMHPERTDLPGLATPKDARYTFPQLQLPELPVGAAGPNELAGDNNNSPEVAAAEGNPILVHLADLRQLLLPAPIGAKAVPGLPGAKGWYPVTALAAEFGDSSYVLGNLREQGVRHVAATGWTTPDGTRTEIDLLAFRSSVTAALAYSEMGSWLPIVASEAQQDSASYNGEFGTHLQTTSLGVANPNAGQVTSSSQPASSGEKAVRVVYFEAGDVVGAVVMTNPKAVPLVDTRQVVTLQDELLQG